MRYWDANQDRYRETLYKQARWEIFSADFYNTMPLEEVFTLYFEHDWLFGKGYSVFYRRNRARQRLSPHPHIRRVIWHKEVDNERARYLAPEDFIPHPTISVAWQEVHDSDFLQLIKQGESIGIPLTGLGEEAVFFGNASNTLVKWNGDTLFEISWAADGPKQWRELTRWVFEVRAYIDRILGHFPQPYPLYIQQRKFLFPPPE